MAEKPNGTHRYKKSFVIATVIGVALAYKIVFLHSITLGYLKVHRLQWTMYHHSHPWASALIFFGAYVALTSISFPGATVLTILGGCLFGLWMGTIICSFASTIGATIAFLLARSIFRKLIEDKYQTALGRLREGVARNEIVYLLSLRLNPIMPFWLNNLLLGLTSIRPWRYYWVSQIGMIPGTILYVNAGTQLAHLNSLRDVMTPSILIAFLLLAIFPFVARYAGRLPLEPRSSGTSRT